MTLTPQAEKYRDGRVVWPPVNAVLRVRVQSLVFCEQFRADVALAGVGRDRDDALSGAEFRRDLESGADRSPGRRSDQQPLLRHQSAGHVQRILIRHL